MEKRHVTGVFICIRKKGPKNDSRIYVLEKPSGKLLDGLLENKTVRGLSLRDCISVDLRDIRTADPNDVFTSQNYNIQPADHLRRQRATGGGAGARG